MMHRVQEHRVCIISYNDEKDTFGAHQDQSNARPLFRIRLEALDLPKKMRRPSRAAKTRLIQRPKSLWRFHGLNEEEDHDLQGNSSLGKAIEHHLLQAPPTRVELEIARVPKPLRI